MTKHPLILLFFTFVLVVVTACETPVNTPKPRAYPRIFYPERNYQPFAEDYCQFTFSYPTYASVQQDTSFFEQQPVHPCWFDLYMPAFDCRLYCSYYPIGEGKTLEELRQDAFEMADWHTKRANFIDERRIDRGPDVQGFAFVMDGPAATPFQFYLTDNKKHFFRGALYFNSRINTDSLAPIYQFVLQDVNKIIESFAWAPAATQ